MKTESLWRLTFDPAGTPLVLLDYRRTVTGAEVRGDMIEGELRWPLKRGLEVVPLVDSIPFLRLSKNSVVTIGFEVYTVPGDGSEIASRVAILDSLIVIDTTARKPLNIQISGYTAHYWQFSSCTLGDHNPGRFVDAAVARIVKGYTLTCTGLSKITGTP